MLSIARRPVINDFVVVDNSFNLLERSLEEDPSVADTDWYSTKTTLVENILVFRRTVVNAYPTSGSYRLTSRASIYCCRSPLNAAALPTHLWVITRYFYSELFPCSCASGLSQPCLIYLLRCRQRLFTIVPPCFWIPKTLESRRYLVCKLT